MNKAVINYILLIIFFCVCLTNNAQTHTERDSIQINYTTGKMGGAIGGKDHSITIWFNDSSIFLTRKCYIAYDYKPKYIDTTLSNLNSDLTWERYNEANKQAILRFYQENDNHLTLDEYVEISKSQFDELIKLINEIKAFESNKEPNSDEIIISTKSNHYVIIEKNGTTIVIDWFGLNDRSSEIEKVLGLKSYTRCPCVEEDVKQMNIRRMKKSKTDKYT